MFDFYIPHMTSIWSGRVTAGHCQYLYEPITIYAHKSFTPETLLQSCCHCDLILQLYLVSRPVLYHRIYQLMHGSIALRLWMSDAQYQTGHETWHCRFVHTSDNCLLLPIWMHPGNRIMEWLSTCHFGCRWSVQRKKRKDKLVIKCVNVRIWHDILIL